MVKLHPPCGTGGRSAGVTGGGVGPVGCTGLLQSTIPSVSARTIAARVRFVMLVTLRLAESHRLASERASEAIRQGRVRIQKIAFTNRR